jgi:hypothetical protein
MRPRTRWVLRFFACSLLLCVTAPIVAVEVVYRWGLHHAGVLPRLPPPPHVSCVHRAVWAAEEGGPMRIEAQWPWTVARFALQSLRAPLRTRPPSGFHLAHWSARNWESRGAPPHLESVWRRWCITIWLTRNASAEQLVEHVAATAYFGRGQYGAEAAASTLFGVTPDELTWAQAALLAGLLQAPAKTDPRCHPTRALARRHHVLLQLHAAGDLSSDELAAADVSPLLPGPATCESRE